MIDLQASLHILKLKMLTVIKPELISVNFDLIFFQTCWIN